MATISITRSHSENPISMICASLKTVSRICLFKEVHWKPVIGWWRRQLNGDDFNYPVPLGESNIDDLCVFEDRFKNLLVQGGALEAGDRMVAPPIEWRRFQLPG